MQAAAAAAAALGAAAAAAAAAAAVVAGAVVGWGLGCLPLKELQQKETEGSFAARTNYFRD